MKNVHLTQFQIDVLLTLLDAAEEDISVSAKVFTRLQTGHIAVADAYAQIRSNLKRARRP